MLRLLSKWMVWLRRYYAPVAVSVAAAVIGAWLYSALYLGSYEFKIEQSRLAALTPAPISDSLVVITVGPSDSRALDNLSTEGFVNHRHYAELINGLKNAGARCLTFDFTVDPAEKEDDEAMRQAVLKASPLLITFLANGEDYVLDEQSPLGRKIKFPTPSLFPDGLPQGVEVGQGELLDTGDTAGAIPLLVRDRETGVTYQHIALCTFRQMFKIPARDVQDLRSSNTVVVGLTSVQAGPAHEMAILWPKASDKISEVSLTDALTMLKSMRTDFFRDKGVIVGTTNDRTRSTVVGEMKGTLIVANAVNTLLRCEGLRTGRLDEYLNYAWSLAVALLASLGLASSRRSVRIGAPMVAILAVSVLPFILILQTHRILGTVGPALTLGLALVGSLAMRALIPAHYPLPLTVPLEGTTMFVDIVDSTLLVSELGPTRSRQVLANFLERASRVVRSHGGEVIRDDGDGLLCFYPSSPDREHACDCIETVAPLQKLASEQGEELDVDLRLTFGIESGAVSRDYHSIHGLAVHKAARLQASCREAKVEILIGPAAKALCEHRSKLTHLDRMKLRGIDESIDVYVIG
jgi:class 3 adenylate cyclase/CHASE2 domain-containing sensor protein